MTVRSTAYQPACRSGLTLNGAAWLLRWTASHHRLGISLTLRPRSVFAAATSLGWIWCMKSIWPVRIAVKRTDESGIGRYTNLVEVGQALFPVAVEAAEREVIVLHPLDEAEGAGAHRVAREVVFVLLDRVPRDHHARAVAEHRQERREGRAQACLDRVGVDDLD